MISTAKDSNSRGVLILTLPYILLGRRTGERERGKLSTPGGWCKEGELPRTAGVREFCEETGIQLSDVEFDAAQRRTVSLADVHSAREGRTLTTTIVGVKNRHVKASFNAVTPSAFLDSLITDAGLESWRLMHWDDLMVNLLDEPRDFDNNLVRGLLKLCRFPQLPLLG